MIAEFTKFSSDSTTVKGFVDDTYSFIAKLFDEDSHHGIDGGRVSKLLVEDSEQKVLMEYDRGWDTIPKDEDMVILEAIMELLENSPKRFL